MVAPGVPAGWAMRARLRGDGIAFCDDGAGNTPFTGTTGLTTAHVNRRDARFGEVTVHRTSREQTWCHLRKPRPILGVKSLCIIGVLGKWFQRANDDRTTADGALGKNWEVCGLPVTPNLVQRQRGRKRERSASNDSVRPPEIDRYRRQEKRGRVRSISHRHLASTSFIASPWLCTGNAGEIVSTMPGNIRVCARRER
jgi:hypothetical protein